MQKTLTLYPRYITAGSSFEGILSTNGTGSDYRTLYQSNGQNLVIGTIGFDSSALSNKSKACILNSFSVSADVWVNRKRDGSGITGTFRPRILNSYSISGTQLTVNGYNEFGTSGDMNAEALNSAHYDLSLFFGSNSDVMGYQKMLGVYLTAREWEFKSWFANQEYHMKNLSASVTYTARYYVCFLDENNALLEIQLVDGGVAPTLSSTLKSKYAKEGYNLVGFRHYESSDTTVYTTPPASVDTDIWLVPVYERIYFTFDAPRLENIVPGAEWIVAVFDESTDAWKGQPSLSFADRTTVENLEYGKRVQVYANNLNADYSQDVVIHFDDDNDGEIFDGSRTTFILVFSTEKLTKDIYIRLAFPIDEFKKISTSCNEGGSITPSFSNPRSYEYQVIVWANTGYEISKITKNGTEIEITDKSKMTITGISNDNTEYVATFAKIKIPITFVHSENITVTGDTTPDYGTTVIWNINTKNGYAIKYITIETPKYEYLYLNIPKAVYSFELEKYCCEPLTIAIIDTNDIVYVRRLNCENGAIVGDFGYYIKGKGVLQFEAIPDPGYYFSAWTGIEQTEQSFVLDTATAEDSYTLGATFEAYAYAVSVEIVGNGQVQQSADYANYDESVTLKAVPDEGWHFVSWSIEREGESGASSVAGEELTVESIHSKVNITATFAISQFSLETLVSSPDGAVGGTIGGNDKDDYDFGTKLTLEAVPAEGYYFVKWSDESYNPRRDYVIPASDTSLTAYFVRYEYDIIADGEKSRIELTTEGKTTESKATVRYGENLSVLITPDFGYRVTDVLLDGTSIKDSLTATRKNSHFLLQDISASHEITVLFEEKMYTNGRKLIDYYPPVIAAIKDMREIVNGQQPLIDELWDAASFVTENQFIDTATEEGVKQWEKELDIVASSLDTLAQRKKRLKSKWVPDNRFTMVWLYDWLRQVSEKNDLKKPTVKDYVLTVTLPAIVDYLSIFSDLEKYKPANIELNSVISLSDGIENLFAGVGTRMILKIKIESEVLTNGNQTD